MTAWFGKGLEKRYLFLAERTDFGAANSDGADRRRLTQQGRNEHGTKAETSPAQRSILVFRFGG